MHSIAWWGFWEKSPTNVLNWGICRQRSHHRTFIPCRTLVSRFINHFQGISQFITHFHRQFLFVQEECKRPSASPIPPLLTVTVYTTKMLSTCLDRYVFWTLHNDQRRSRDWPADTILKRCLPVPVCFTWSRIHIAAGDAARSFLYAAKPKIAGLARHAVQTVAELQPVAWQSFSDSIDIDNTSKPNSPRVNFGSAWP